MAAKNMIHVVYAYSTKGFHAMRVNEKVGTIRIHQAIAAFENDFSQSGREWRAPIEAGSFNIMKIKGAEDRHDAIEKARRNGLQHEPKNVVLARYRADLNSARRAFEDIGRRGSSSPSQSTTRDQSFTGETESILKEVFGDFLRPDNKYGPKR